jgi:hypothetical protein
LAFDTVNIKLVFLMVLDKIALEKLRYMFVASYVTIPVTLAAPATETEAEAAVYISVSGIVTISLESRIIGRVEGIVRIN